MATRIPHSPPTGPRRPPAIGWARSFLRGQLAIVLGALAGIAVCAVLLLILAALHAPASIPVPDGAARALCSDLQSRDYAAFYALLTPDQQAAGTSDQFVASQRELDITRGRVTTCRYTVRSAGADQALLAVTVQRAGGSLLTGSITLRFTDGAWRIAAYDASSI